MLVLTYTDGFRVYFHQFSQRVHQSAGDGYSSAHCDVVFRKFITRNLGCRVNGSPLLAYNKYLNFLPEGLVFQKLFCFTTCRSVSYRYGFYMVSFYHLLYFRHSFCGFVYRGMRVDILIVQ